MLLTMIVSPVKAVGQTTETLNITSYATANSWVSGTAYTPISTAHVTITGLTNGNNSKYYSSNNSWRHYEGDNGTVTLSVSSDYTLSSVTFTYAAGNSGVLKDGTTNVTSGTEYALSGTTKTFSVGHSSGTKNGNVQIQNIVINIQSASSTTTPTSITIDASGITNTNVFVGTAAGSFSAAVTETASGDPVVGAAVTWTSSDEEIATIGETTGAVTLVAAGTTTITANYAGNSTYSSSSKTYSLTVINQDPNAPGSVNNPYTVAQAIANTPSSGTSDNVYIQGIVSAFYNTSIVGDGTNFRYYISDDGTTANQLLVYRGKGLNEATFTSADDLLVGDEVVIYGKLTLYQSAPEIAANNYLTSWNRPVSDVATPTFNPEGGIYNEAQNVTLSCATDGASIYYTTDGSTPDNTSTPYNNAINVTSTTTIKAIAYVGTDASSVASATYTIISFADISSITEVGTAYMVRGTVVATNNRGFVMGDGTGYVYYYKGSDAGKNVGDMVTVSGTTGTYGQIIQFTNSATVEEATTSNYNNTPAATVITEVPDYSTGYHLSTYLEFEGALAKSGSNYLITLGESQIQISYPTTDQANTLTALDGKNVTVKGYFTGINSSSKFTTMLESVEEVAEPAIAITPAAINEVPCLGGGGTLTVTCTNMGNDPELSIVFCDAQGTAAEYNWISAVFNGDGNVVGTINPNSGAQRTAYLKVCATEPQVCSNIVSITQLAYNDPTATVTSLPFEFDGSKSEIATTDGIIENGLDDGYSSSPRLKFKNEGAHVVLHFNEAPGTLTYDIKGDGFSGSTFTVMTSTDNNTYTALKTYTTLSNDVQHETFNTLSADIRYIKWIYTTKEDGKVALGNIGLTKVSSEPSITATNIALAYDDEEGEIAYTINNPVSGGEVSAEVIGTTTWFYLDDVDETNYKVPFNCDANTGVERSATVRLTYTYNTDQTTTKDVTITQAANPDPINNISEITAAGTYAVRGTIVAKSSRGFIVGDGTGYIYYYNQSYDQSAYNIGDKVKLSGSVVAYGKVFEFNNETVVTESATSNYDPANAYPTELTGAQMQSIVGSSANRLSDFVVYHGTLSVSGTYYNITNIAGATSATGSISYPLNTDFASLDGKQVTVIGYFVGVSSTRYNTMIGEIVKTPSIVADDVTIQYNETSGSIAYSISDAAEDGWFNAEVEDGSWITITQPIGNDAVAFTCDENTGDAARTQNVTLLYSYHNYQDTIEKVVTVTQQPHIVPVASITVDPTELNVNADEHDGIFTVAYENIETDLGASVVWFESDGVTVVANEPEWITADIDDVTLNVDYIIDANTGDARTAYFKVYGLDGDGEDVYSNLVTITQAAPVIDYATLPFEWAGGTKEDLVANVGVSGYGLGSNYAVGNAPYRVKFDNNGDYILVKTNEQPGEVTVGIKKVGGANASSITIKGSSNGEDFTTIQTFDNEGDANAVLEHTTTVAFNENDRYVMIYFNKPSGGSNVGVGPITIAQVDHTPSITINPALVEATATETPGNMAITISNMTISDVEQLSADFCDANGDDISSKPDWITDFDFQLNAGVFTGTYTIQANTTTEPRTAYFHVYGLDDDGVTEAYSNVVTVNQEASVAPVASITIDPYLVEATADETEGNLAITLENIVITEEGGGSFDLIFCDSNGEQLANQSDKPEWFGFDFPFENNAWSVYYLIGENTTTTARAAYFKVYALGDNGVTEATSDLVTVTQDGAVVYYSVSFDCDGGTFVGNDEFPNAVNENVLAGTHALPSATKSGLTFDGWKLDGTDDIYDAGAQYEVTTNVSFTAQWSSAVTGTITFGSAEGSTAINSTSVNGDDSAGNTWTITTVFSGQTSFTQNASYSQVGASSKPAESITFTTTLANEVNITAFSAKFGGFSNTAGDIALIVDETTIGTGSLNASEDVVVTNTTTESGTVLTVTVTNIAKGVKCYYISYTYEVDNTPSISINQGPYDLNSEGGDAELEVTYSNMPTDPQAVVIFYESNGETPLTENPTWITATINANGNVDGHIDANTGDARSAYFKVKGKDADGNDVYSGLVTVNQAAYTLSIVFETTSLDIEAGGEQDRIISFEYEGLGENPTFTVRQYDATGQTQTTYDWLTTTITDVHKVNITVAANTGDARSAYFKVYGENGTINTESNLVTINQAAAAPAGETFTLLTNVDQIVAGQHYLITNGSNKAMGVQNNNNRAAADVTISAGTATYAGDDVYEVVISGPDANGNYSIYDQRTPGYLFAASSGSNYLRTRAENSDNNSMWKITIDNEGVASIIAQGSNSRNVMRYNGGSSLFACYGSASQSPVYLFKKNDEKTYNFYSNTTVASLTVDNDGACIVHEDVALEVTGTITNNGGADNILIMNLGQLINKNNVVATLQRDIKGYGDDPNVADGWQTIASPVDGISTSVVATAPYDLYMYNEPNAYWYSNTGSVPFNTLSRSIGYLYANANDMTLNFAGEMIRTDQVVPQTLSYTSNQTDDVRGYNLMGNPFTCNLNAGDIAWINGDAEYFTSYSIAIPTSANLVTYNINERPIKTGEGFFVQASDENQEISFVKTASKDGVANNGYISINANTEVNFDNAYIQIGNGNTLRKMSIATSSVVYVMNDGDDYAAARVEELAGSMPVYFDAAEDGQCTITITANNLVAHSMHLIDNFTGEDIDLLVNPSYTFFANESDDAARFTLMFDFNDYTGVNESYVNGNFAYQSGDELFISGDGTLQVFDVMGRFVMSKEIHGSESVSVSAFETGVYMLRFVGETVMTQKIVIR